MKSKPNAFSGAICFSRCTRSVSPAMRHAATTTPSHSGGVVGRTNSDIDRARSERTPAPASELLPPEGVAPGLGDDQSGNRDHFRVITPAHIDHCGLEQSRNLHHNDDIRCHHGCRRSSACCIAPNNGLRRSRLVAAGRCARTGAGGGTWLGVSVDDKSDLDRNSGSYRRGHRSNTVSGNPAENSLPGCRRSSRYGTAAAQRNSHVWRGSRVAASVARY